MLVSDLRHFLDMPADAPSPARRMADRLGRVVSAATAGDVGATWTSGIRCERRPAHRRCAGFIDVVRQTSGSPIRWWCTTCDDDVLLAGSREDVEELAGYVAAESNHEQHRPRQRKLDAVLDALERALASRS